MSYGSTMDIRDLLKECITNCDIKTDDNLINHEINNTKKYLQNTIDTINDVGKDRDLHIKMKQKSGYIINLLMPYIVYLNMIIDEIPINIENKDINFAFITEILQKHLELINK